MFFFCRLHNLIFESKFRSRKFNEIICVYITEFSRFSPKNDVLQVFIGNIPHEANEEDIHQMFSRFGRISRVRLHSNPRKEWLPRYAFISYDNVQSVRQCLMNKVILIFFDLI